MHFETTSSWSFQTISLKLESDATITLDTGVRIQKLGVSSLYRETYKLQIALPNW